MHVIQLTHLAAYKKAFSHIKHIGIAELALSAHESFNIRQLSES